MNLLNIEYISSIINIKSRRIPCIQTHTFLVLSVLFLEEIGRHGLWSLLITLWENPSLSLTHSPISFQFPLSKVLWNPKVPSKVKAFVWSRVLEKSNSNNVLQIRRPSKALSPAVCRVPKIVKPQINYSHIAQLPVGHGLAHFQLLMSLESVQIVGGAALNSGCVFW